jgi:hypothetical protein
MAEDTREEMRLLRRFGSVGGRAGAADRAPVDRLLRRGLVHETGGAIQLTDLGKAALRRHLAGADGFAAQHQTRVTVGIEDGTPGGRGSATVNADESPLSRLARSRGRDGAPLLSQDEVAAGERLRADFTRGQLMPRITANWSAGVVGRRRGGGGGGMAEMSDAIVAARQRVDRALAAVGPDFSGLLLDVCCFLKGVEIVERERGWPARSAKLVLRLSLASLARHYGLGRVAAGPRTARVVHWGADDYRPEIAPAGEAPGGASP